MKILFDTSVLVAGIVERHPMHESAFPWLKDANAGQFEFIVSAHSLAELYAVLTALPLSPKIAPGTAWRLIRENVQSRAKVIPLSPTDYGSVIRRMADLGLSGGAVYDALIAKAAEKASIDHILTLNPDDFKRVWPEGQALIRLP
jgi:predicted nucleic acid-binding protein